VLPPPKAITKSHLFSFAITAPFCAVSVVGFDSTPLNTTVLTPAFSQYSRTLSKSPVFLVLLLPVTIIALLPNFAACSPIVFTLPAPNIIFTGNV
jgi:hypothetical protein